MKISINPKVWAKIERRYQERYSPSGEVVYIAGPYRAKNAGQIYDNIARARQAALSLWQRGYIVICPHMNTAFFDGHLTDDKILAGDLELLRRSDVVVAMDGWRLSVGARAEVRLALKLNKPILGEDGKLLAESDVSME